MILLYGVLSSWHFFASSERKTCVQNLRNLPMKKHFGENTLRLTKRIILFIFTAISAKPTSLDPQTWLYRFLEILTRNSTLSSILRNYLIWLMLIQRSPLLLIITAVSSTINCSQTDSRVSSPSAASTPPSTLDIVSGGEEHPSSTSQEDQSSRLCHQVHGEAIVSLDISS